jgi:hypothetical protein
MRIQLTPAGKIAAAALLLAGAIAIVVFEGPEARRYLKMEGM